MPSTKDSPEAHSGVAGDAWGMRTVDEGGHREGVGHGPGRAVVDRPPAGVVGNTGTCPWDMKDS